MSEMKELVARAIYEASNHNKAYSQISAFQREKCEREAVAAITAMREPDVAMGDAAQDVPSGIGGCPPHWATIYRAMIDAALKEPA